MRLVPPRSSTLGLLATLTAACGGGPATPGTGTDTSTGSSTTTMMSTTTGEASTTSTTGTPTTSGTSEGSTAPVTSETGSSGAVTTSGSSGEATTGSSGTTDGTTGSSGDPGSTSDTGEPACEAPGILLVCDDGDDADPWHAIGVGCPGAIENTIPIKDPKFVSQPIAWRAATGFGTAVDPNNPGELLFRPREGEKFLVLSTGRLANLKPDGTLIEINSQYNNDNNFNPDQPNQLPAPMSPLVGSNGGAGGTPFMGCDGQHDCSDSIEPNWTLGNGDPNDLLWGSFAVTVPLGVDSFLFDAVFFSSEYPEFVGKKFNDMFIGWTTSEAYTGNVTFFEGRPFTVTALAPAIESAGYVGNAQELEGTGFEGHGSTGWVTIQSPVAPGETFTFALAIMDMGDSSKATVVLVDHWRWDCKGCVPIELDPQCGTNGHPKCCGLCVDKLDDPQCGTDGHPKCCTGE